MKTLIPFFAVVGLVSSHAGDFVNLDFESPDLSHLVQGPFNLRGFASDVFRGWTVTGGGSPLFDRIAVSTARGDLASPISLTVPNPPFFTGGVDFGNHGVWVGLVDPIGLSYEFTQTGLIPRDAVGLTYYTVSSDFAIIRINGTTLVQHDDPLTRVGHVDVSPYAGHEVTLKITLVQGPGMFDIAGFERTPEPATWALLGLGSAALLWMGRGGGMRR